MQYLGWLFRQHSATTKSMLDHKFSKTFTAQQQENSKEDKYFLITVTVSRQDPSWCPPSITHLPEAQLTEKLAATKNMYFGISCYFHIGFLFLFF